MKSPGHDPRKNERGFSLAEVLIVVAIAASVVMVVSNFGGNITLLNNLVGQQLQSASDIDETLQIMMTEIRSAGASGNGGYSIDSATTSSFAFYSDIYKTGSMEYVKYYLTSSTIYKEVIQPTGTPASYPTSSAIITDVIDNVLSPTTSTPLFTYFDTNYSGSQSGLSSPITVSAIRLVDIIFRADVQPKQAPGPDYFSMLVDIRNLRSN